ncbi:transcriptional regulator, XRE family [Thermovibrio ammonificans HB-1]|uniref:Transcriptional regulator, XRE family n=1 Tax=Thermovibrio ammonificans (strain DSM 15698 / JCM 12110 / HB-1) TaxID=648996 RepID=E8T317_THEA1|nr:LexA family transcriptional regulator [Thermovibrio ammonificans]ADU96022.1 transcriptional regulator, XRE family [Thermovibrio ammonificans HB-1]
MSVNERLRKLREHLGLSQSKMAKELGVSLKTYQRYEQVGYDIPERALRQIEATFNVNPEWLRQGKGEMFRPKTEAQIIATPEFVVKPIPLIAEGEAGFGQFIPNLVEPDKVVWFPVPTSLANHRLFFIKVVGNSMEPRIFEGDIVLVDKDATVGKGDLVAALLKDGTLVVKRYWKNNGDGTVVLESINPSYPPIVVRPKELRDIALVRFIVPNGDLIDYNHK